MCKSPQRETIEVHGGLALRLWRHRGQRGAPVVLFLHGYLDTGRSYDDLVALLGGRVEALVLDWRGHGESQRVGPGGSYHMLDHVKDLSAVLHALKDRGDEVEAVVAHSMGANISLLLSGAWPELMPRLLVMDALGGTPEESTEQAARIGSVLRSMRRVKKFRVVDSREEAIQRVMDTNFGLGREGAERMIRHALVPVEGEPGKLTFALDPKLRGPTPVRYPNEMWVATLGRIAAPVILLRAEFGYVPLRDAQVRARLDAFGRVLIRTLENAYHNLHVEHCEAVGAALDELLSIPAREG